MTVFAETSPPELSIMVAGHNASLLHTARLWAADDMVAIGEEELAFGEDETRALADLLGADLTPQSIAFADDSGNDLHFTAPLADDLEQFLAVGVIAAQRARQGRR